MKRRSLLKTAAVAGATPLALNEASQEAEAIELNCALSFSREGGYTSQDVEIESFDGTTIAGTVYVPDGDGPHPSVLMTHGWSASREFVDCLAGNYAANGYVTLAYDSRGFGESEGEVGVDGPDEVGDVSVLIDWLADRDDVRTDGDGDPDIGMDGGSYAGGIQLLAAAADDRIDAIVPRIAWNDLEHSLAPNGTIKSGWLTALIGLGTISSGLTGDIGESIDDRFLEWYSESVNDNEFPEDAVEPFARRSPGEVIDDIQAPTLVISGLKDTLFTPNEGIWNYEEIGENGVESRLMLYRAGHNAEELKVSDEENEYMNDAALNWMERHVRGDDGFDVPEFSVFSEQEETWNEYSQYPPAEVSRETFDLNDIAWSWDSTSGINNPSPWKWWEWESEATFDVPVDSEVEILGAPRLKVTVEADDELVLFASLHDVDEWGTETQIGDQVTAFRLPGGTTESFDLEMVAAQRVIESGHKLRLKIEAEDPFYVDEYGSGRVVHPSGESTLEVPFVEGSL